MRCFCVVLLTLLNNICGFLLVDFLSLINTRKCFLQLDSSPWCGSCSLTLDYNLPADGLARLMAATGMDLGAKNRQLSTLLVEPILQGKQDERLNDLLKIVQASDLSALSNTMTAELVGFIQGIIS